MQAERVRPKVELGELRGKLDRMTERIVSLFKDRVSLPHNPVIYVPNGVAIDGRSDVSLFTFAVEGLEAYHASLGRYNYPGQFPLFRVDVPGPKVKREVTQVPLAPVDIDVRDNLFTFYQNIMAKYCKLGNDPNTYGTAANLDARLVSQIHERINLGRYVSEAKIDRDPTINSSNSAEELMGKLKDRAREEDLIEKARKLAEASGLNPDMAEEAFRWMIETTLFIEIAYIQGLP